MKKLKALLAAAALGALLSGCTVSEAPEHRVFTSWEDNARALEELRFFKAEGRAGIIAPEGRQSAGYTLDGIPGGFVLALTTPFGNTAATVSATQSSVAFTYDGRTFRDEAAVAVFREVFGIELPLSEAKKIFLGIPEGRVRRGAGGRIEGTEWNGLEVSYEWQLEQGGLRVPQNITVKRGSAMLKLSVRSFKAGAQ